MLRALVARHSEPELHSIVEQILAAIASGGKDKGAKGAKGAKAKGAADMAEPSKGGGSGKAPRAGAADSGGRGGAKEVIEASFFY